MILMLICAYTVTSCRTAVPADVGSGSDSDTPAFVEQETFPDIPPTLTVSCGEEQITAWRGTYSWEVVNALGIGQAVCADSMHPLEVLETVPVLTAGADIQLFFDAPPDSMIIRRYPLGAMQSYENYETIITDGGRMSLSDGTALYEVIAGWDKSDKTYSGDAYYAFRTE